MKKFYSLTAFLFIQANILYAQTDWHIKGNTGTNSSANFIGTKDTAALNLRTSNAVRMTLTSSGNVGIGTTNPKSKLDVAGAITGFDSYFGSRFPVSAGTSGASYSSVGYGLTFTDTTANYRYRINADYSSMLSFRSGGFDFNTAPIGTAGNVIPYTTAMTILQNGNVGIGTSSPANKFSVTAAPAALTSVAFIQNTGGTNGSDGLYIKTGTNGLAGAYFIAFFRPDGLQIGAITQNTATAVGYTTISDKRLKNIIGGTQKGLSDLMKINIYDYTFKSDASKKVQTGFMAQELYDIFPQAVSKPRETNEPAEKNPWMVDYGRVTPLIIKAVQELYENQKSEVRNQNDEIEELKKQNADLQKQIDALKAMIVSNQSTIISQLSSASVQQNIPNPFNHTTTISYTLPQTYSSAKIIVTDKSGKSLKEVNVYGKGNGSLKLDASTLASGAYQYSFYVEGKLVDTKQMLLTK
ncbi:hypothetical protein FRZ67_04645 [Panacibacter ginsenosidivorans]|uniref:Peptidase S74 domain-containing protein n=1 Tax=Panacibacter ginsenosidivorans TaxID=1813871 RepID=A0A5B8V5F9_9BACT|nr:tail fiber domain-containing protein [Panacibacter ginsenosidivorans]QEC66620.1 hypothetical protein FRZ67_04645 [Panacibacter ginsenosidivorans]